MADQIYVVDPATQEPVRVEPVSFYDIGVMERKDLERWVAKDPGLLGEPLLAITTEFSRFDKSSRRLDILAIDTRANLVVIELKLDASRSLADQQAIRYAAFCSTMSMDDVVDALANFERSTREEAARRIRDFLDVRELPGLGRHPRIILAAGAIEDQELTSCVLWLRGFGMDISCIQLTPYRVSDSAYVILVPKTVIPLPEAQQYTVRVERREISRVHKNRRRSANADFWMAVADEFNRLGAGFYATGRSSGPHMCLRFGSPAVHYEWIVRKAERRLDIALHFEFDEREESFRWLELVRPHSHEISRGTNYEFELVPWSRKWAEARFRIPFSDSSPSTEAVPEAARLMKILIDRTWPVIEAPIRSSWPAVDRRLSQASVALLTRANRLGLLDKK